MKPQTTSVVPNSTKDSVDNKPLECFKLFFTPDIVNKVVTHTNEEIL